jgi:hypothetical protein
MILTYAALCITIASQGAHGSEWHGGVVHLHSTYSDGTQSPVALAALVDARDGDNWQRVYLVPGIPLPGFEVAGEDYQTPKQYQGYQVREVTLPPTG